MSSAAIPIAARLKALADTLDPQTDGVAVLIVGEVQIELGITATGNDQFDATRLVTALVQAQHVSNPCTCTMQAEPTGFCIGEYEDVTRRGGGMG